MGELDGVLDVFTRLRKLEEDRDEANRRIARLEAAMATAMTHASPTQNLKPFTKAQAAEVLGVSLTTLDTMLASDLDLQKCYYRPTPTGRKMLFIRDRLEAYKRGRV